MARYRKKPVEIEAVQLLWTTWNEMCDFLGDDFFIGGGQGCWVDLEGNSFAGTEPPPHLSLDEARIGLLINTMLAVQDDWVIRGVKGELYPCKPDIFEATYEPCNQE